MGKIKIDGDLWKALWQTAVRLTGYKTQEKAKKEEIPVVAKDKYRDQLLVYDNSTYLWLCDHIKEEQEVIIDFLYRKGVITDTYKVRCQISDWHKHGHPGYNGPIEAAPMSDDVLDRWTQYLSINKDLFDNPKQSEENDVDK